MTATETNRGGIELALRLRAHGRCFLLPDRQVELDAGYRYSHIKGGRMFE